GLHEVGASVRGDRPVGVRARRFTPAPRMHSLGLPTEWDIGSALQDPPSRRDPRGARGAPMRVAVIGATGNVGTEVLAALARRPEVTSILAVARRLPETAEEPYASAEWARIDIGAQTAP